jgi:ribosomal protein L11 methylase PrmA
MRGISLGAGRKEVTLKYILKNIQKTDKILDVGFGSGIYGKIFSNTGSIVCWENRGY